MNHNYVTVHVTGTSALDIIVARTPQIPVKNRAWGDTDMDMEISRTFQ